MNFLQFFNYSLYKSWILFISFFPWTIDFVSETYNKWFFATSIIYDMIKYFINVNILIFFNTYLQLLIIYHLISPICTCTYKCLLQNCEQILTII